MKLKTATKILHRIGFVIFRDHIRKTCTIFCHTNYNFHILPNFSNYSIMNTEERVFVIVARLREEKCNNIWEKFQRKLKNLDQQSTQSVHLWTNLKEHDENGRKKKRIEPIETERIQRLFENEPRTSIRRDSICSSMSLRLQCTKFYDACTLWHIVCTVILYSNTPCPSWRLSRSSCKVCRIPGSNWKWKPSQ